MATPQSQPETSLQVKRTFAVPRDRVFRAWTDAKQFALWFHPTTDYTTVITELDLRVGGAYSLEMHHKGGNIHTLRGTYKEVRPPEKLVFTWRWQREDASPESLVTVEFRDLGSSTEVSLTHQNLINAEERAKHNEGWNGCLEQLAKYLA
jgi:uncharacterized protein YndB with AHSA1/START domain